MSGRRLDASGLLDWAHAAVGGLVVHAEEMNRLNVFPVADADTGTNMLFTMRAALADAEKRAKKSDDVAHVAAALARGALHRARGNSGVILSQILRGLADVTASAAADTGNEFADINAVVFGAGLRHAVGLVVGSMGEEVPGTIVSVLHTAAATAEHCAADGDDLSDTVVATADAAVTALEKTPAQLGVLAEFGVVDAGGRGLVVLLDALAATLTGHTPARSEYVPAPPTQGRAAAEPAPDLRPPHYEVMYQISGTDQRLDSLRERLGELGDSVAIAGDGADRYSVHVHADDAGAAVEAAFAVGTPSHIQISTLRGGAASGRWARRRARRAAVRRRRRASAALQRGKAGSGRLDQREGLAAGGRRHRRRPDHGVAQRLCRRRRARGGLHGGRRLGARRRAGALRGDGAGAGGARRPRAGPGGRRRRVLDGASGRWHPARFRAGCHRSGLDLG